MWLIVGGSGRKWCKKFGTSGIPDVLLVKWRIEQMFLGHYTHTLDTKGRLTIPARYREQLAEGAYMTRGFERNLMVLPPPVFEFLAARVSALSITEPKARQLMRLMFSNADKVELDNAGRFRIPTFLRDAFGLESEVIVAGSGGYFELWTPEEWAPQADLINDAETNAERFADLNLALSL